MGLLWIRGGFMNEYKKKLCSRCSGLGWHFDEEGIITNLTVGCKMCGGSGVEATIKKGTGYERA